METEKVHKMSNGKGEEKKKRMCKQCNCKADEGGKRRGGERERLEY